MGETPDEIHRAAALSDQVIVPLVLSSAVNRRSEQPAGVADLGTKSLKEMVREVTGELEEGLIREALRRTGGQKAGAARLLGVSRPTLDSKIDAYGIDVKRA